MEACNINAKGITMRAVLGSVLLVAGLGLGIYLVLDGRPWWLRFLLVSIPMLLGALALLQARGKV